MYKPLNTEKLLQQCRNIRAKQLTKDAKPKNFATYNLVDSFAEAAHRVEDEWEELTEAAEDIEKRIQDVLHELELQDDANFVELGKQLQTLRRERREVSDTKEILEPFKDWCSKNFEARSALSIVRNEMKKTLNNQATRLYTYKSDEVGTSGTFLQSQDWFKAKPAPHIEDDIKFAEESLDSTYEG